MIDRPTTFQQGGPVKWTIFIRDTNGDLLDADSNPSVTVYKNGTVTADVVTVTKRASTAGIYDCSYDPASEVAGDCFGFEESVAISSTTYVRNPWQCVCVPSLVNIESTVGSIPVDEYSAGDGTLVGATLDILTDTGTTLPAQIAGLNDTLGDIDSATAAINARATEARLAKLDVTGTLANTDNADLFKATNVTVDAMAQAALAQFATDDTGETSSAAGSVATLSKAADGADPTLVPHVLEIYSDENEPIQGAAVIITTDANGLEVFTAGHMSDELGRITVNVEAGTTYYAWQYKDNYSFNNPGVFTP